MKGYPEANIQGIKVFSVGREDSEKKRHLKVILGSLSEVKKVVAHSRELKKIDSFKSVSLSFDRTPKQTAEFKAVKATLNLRIQ